MAIKLRPVIIKGKGLLEISKEIESMVGELAKPSGAQTLKALSFDYSLLFSTIFLFHWARSSGNFTLLELMVIGFLCLFPLGAAAHGIGVIGHDNAHRISFKNLKVNDHAGRWLISYPLIVFSVDRFWKVHKQHHLGLNSDNDPDYISSMSSKSFHFPMSRGRYAWVLFKTFFFGGLIHYSGTSDAAKQKREEKVTLGYKVGLAFYWVSVVAVVAYFGLFWELGLWVLSLLTAAMLFIKIRMDVEHYGLDIKDDFSGTRTVNPGIIESIIFCPHNVSFHLEHHLFQTIPFYNLPKVRDILSKHTNYTELTNVHDGYFLGKNPAIKTLFECPKHDN